MAEITRTFEVISELPERRARRSLFNDAFEAANMNKGKWVVVQRYKNDESADAARSYYKNGYAQWQFDLERRGNVLYLRVN